MINLPEAITPLERLADTLHRNFCSNSHSNNECLWFQEEHWSDYSHMSWTIKAREIMREINSSSGISNAGRGMLE